MKHHLITKGFYIHLHILMNKHVYKENFTHWHAHARKSISIFDINICTYIQIIYLYLYIIYIYIFTACAWTLEWPFPLKRMHALPSRKTTCPAPPMLPLSEERVCMVMSRSNALQYGLNLSALGEPAV